MTDEGFEGSGVSGHFYGDDHRIAAGTIVPSMGDGRGLFAATRRREGTLMELKQWPVSNVTLGHFPRTRSDVVLQALCDMPADTPTVNRYERDERYPSSEERGWRKLPDPRGPALLMTKFESVGDIP